jgi:hypothetical protein
MKLVDIIKALLMKPRVLIKIDDIQEAAFYALRSK